MVKFTPDFTGVEPWLGDDAPHEFALRRWMAYLNADDDMDFNTACELAEFDREVYDALFQWTADNPVAELPMEVQAKLAVALLRQPPRRGKGANARRNARLRALAGGLRARYGLPVAQPIASGPVPCVAAILAGLPGTPSEGTIAREILQNLQG